MTIVLHGQDSVIEQAHKQLEDIVPVWAVLDYTRTRVIEREILLIKVSVVPESAIKDNSPEGEALSLAPGSRARVGAEVLPVLLLTNLRILKQGKQPTMGLPPLLASSVQRQALTDLSRLFEGRVVDVSLDSVTIELSAKPSRIDSFIELVKPFGIIEVARSGVMAMPRSSASASSGSTLDEDDTSTSVDATMLPPG